MRDRNPTPQPRPFVTPTSTGSAVLVVEESRPRAIRFTFLAGSVIAATLASACATSAHADPPPGYYASANGLSGPALHAALHEIIDDHVRFPYTASSTDTWDILSAAHEDPNAPANVRTVYRNSSVPKTDHTAGSGWNREHTWPKSYGFPDDGGCNYPYTDCHMLMPSDWDYNSARSNRPYDDCPGACDVWPVDGVPGAANFGEGSFGDGSWETWSDRRGDCRPRSLLLRGALRRRHARDDRLQRARPATHRQPWTDRDHRLERFGRLHGRPLDLDRVAPRRPGQSRGGVQERRGRELPGEPKPVHRPPRVRLRDLGLPRGRHHSAGGPAGARGDRSRLRDLADLDPEPRTRPRELHPLARPGRRDPHHARDGLSSASFVDATAQNGSVYDYAVSAVDTVGNESAPSPVLVATPSGVLPCGGGPITGDPWINEIHYDNSGGDVGEGFEIAGPAGTDLSGYAVLGYNGNGGVLYDTVLLAGTIPDQQNGAGTLWFAMPGMQNGAPDALALVAPGGSVIEFLSYEGTVTASDGDAAG